MALPSTLQRSRSAVVYIKAETTAGQIADAPVSGDAFGLTTVPVIAQAGNYADTSEIGSELVSVDRVLNYMDYATFDLEFYAKPKQLVTASALSTTGVTLNGTIAVVAMGSTTGIAVGDTVTIAGASVATINGDQVVTAVVADTSVTYASTSTGTVSGTVTVTKKTLNTPPEDVIFQNLFGGVKFDSVGGTYQAGEASKANVTASNKTVVSYFLKNSISTVSVHSVQETDTNINYYVGKGALPTSFSISLAKDGPVTMSVGFQANKVLYAGTAEVDSAPAGNGSGETITLSGPKRYASTTMNASDVMWFESAESQGTPFKIISNDGATTKKSGLEITAISGATISTTTATNSPSSAYAADDLIVPDLPAPACDTTTTIDQRSVQVFMTDEVTGTGMGYSAASNTELFHADNAIDVTAVSFDFDRSITTPGLSEMTGDEFPPASYVINEPTVTGSMSLLLRPKDFHFMNSLRDEPKRSIGVRIGTVNGKIIELACASAHFEVPSASEADGATSIDLSFTVVRGQDCDDADKFFLRYR